MSENKNSFEGFKKYIKANGFYILTGVTLIAVVITAVVVPKKREEHAKQESEDYTISKARTEESINDLRKPTIDMDFEDDFIVEYEEEDNEPTFSQDQEEEEAEVQEEKPEVIASEEVAVAKAEEELVAETFSTTTVAEAELFHPDDEMFVWPIESELIYKFSDNNEGNSFMNPTLERTMRTFGLMLAAKENDLVSAAAKGKVIAVGDYPKAEDMAEGVDYPRVGNAITIDHGNNWTSVYGLHKGEALVEVGDLVELGQEIGKVGLPSKDFLLTGNNLYFQVLKDKVPVNPEEKLDK